MIILAIIAVAAVIEFLFEDFLSEHLMSPHALEHLYHVSQIGFAFVTFFFLRLMSYNKKYMFAVAVPVLEAALVIVAHLTGIGVKISEDYVLSVGIMTYVLLITNIVFYVLQLALVIAENKKHQNTSYFVYGLMSMTLLAGRTIQWFFPQSKVFLVSITITVLLYTIFLANSVKQTDEITKLLNRDSFDNNINRTPIGAIIMIYDIDCFKQVNDNNGHDYGDIVLEKIGNMLMKVY